MTTNPRRRTRAIVTGFVAAVALVLATAAPAGASTINITPPTPPATDYDNLDLIDIWGSAPSGATHFAVAQCDVSGATTEEELGELCYLDTSVPPTPLSAGTYLVEEFELHDSWSPNHDFSGGSPTDVGGSTTCANLTGGTECAIVVSYYQFPIPGFVGADSSTVVF